MYTSMCNYSIPIPYSHRSWKLYRLVYNTIIHSAYILGLNTFAVDIVTLNSSMSIIIDI